MGMNGIPAKVEHDRFLDVLEEERTRSPGSSMDRTREALETPEQPSNQLETRDTEPPTPAASHDDELFSMFGDL